MVPLLGRGHSPQRPERSGDGSFGKPDGGGSGSGKSGAEKSSSPGTSFRPSGRLPEGTDRRTDIHEEEPPAPAHPIPELGSGISVTPIDEPEIIIAGFPIDEEEPWLIQTPIVLEEPRYYTSEGETAPPEEDEQGEPSGDAESENEDEGKPQPDKPDRGIGDEKEQEQRDNKPPGDKRWSDKLKRWFDDNFVYTWDRRTHGRRGGGPHWDRGSWDGKMQEWSSDGINWHPK